MADGAPDPADVTEQIRQIEQMASAIPGASPALQRLSARLTDLGRWMITTRDEAQLEQAADQLEALTRQIEPPPVTASRYLEPAAEGGDPRVNQRSTHPLVGRSNPVSPAIDVRVEQDQVIGEVTFDTRFEGHVGWVHGGFVAAGFDIIAVLACRLSGRAGPTGTLSVRYLAPTPVGVPLRYEGQLSGTDGRKLFASAQLVRCDDGRPTARAEAVAVSRT